MGINVLPNTTPPVVLSGQLVQAMGSDKVADIVIAGIPFLLMPTQEDPYVRQSSEDQRDQFDSSREAGENSLGQWWLRSQATMHGGQGQTYLESQGAAEVTRTRYAASSYAYPHTPGEVSIAGTVTSVAGTRKGAEQVTWSSVQKLVTMSTATFQIHVANLPDLSSATTISLGATGVPTAMTTDGSNVHVAIADKIYRVNSSGVATHTHNLTFSGPVAMGFAKSRLIVCVGNKVYELDPNPSVPPVAVTTPHYTNAATDFVYTSVAEGPNGIYLAGYSGTASHVSSMSVTESGSSVVLGPPIVQLRLPPAELVNDIFFYVSSFFALATTNGIRVGQFTPYGQPQVGTLLIPRTPCYTITGSGTLLYVGAQDSVWTVDLSTPVDQVGGYAHAKIATDLGATDTDPVSGLVVYTGDRDLLFGSTGTGRLVSQPTFVTTTPATLTTSWARFDTTEPKTLHYITVEGSAVDAEVTVETVTGDTATFVCDGSADSYEFSTSNLPQAQAFRLSFALNSGTIRSYQLKALPAPRRYKEIVLPLQLMDSEQPASGPRMGYKGYARDRLDVLEALNEDNVRVTVKDNITNLSYQAVIKRLQYRQELKPTSSNKLGGILNVILRLV